MANTVQKVEIELNESEQQEDLPCSAFFKDENNFELRAEDVAIKEWVFVE